MYTSLVGCPLSDVDTPALVVDLDALDHNIATMAADIAARGAQWRPHSKANKTPAIVHKEIAAGAIGVTCAKVGEAEVMAAAGIRDILIANQVVGHSKTRRLAWLAREADVIVAVDNPDNVLELDCAAGQAGTRPRILIEVNSGMERCGALPGGWPGKGTRWRSRTRLPARPRSGGPAERWSTPPTPAAPRDSTSRSS